MLKKSLTALGLMFLITQTAIAATISFSSGPFGATLDIFADDSGDFSFGTPGTVTGLQQFDPALGTLTGVSFVVSMGAFSFDAELLGDPMIDASFTGEFEGSMQADLLYSNGTSSIVLDLIPAGISLYCEGDHPDLCEDSISDSYDFSIDSLVIPRTVGEFMPADIIGTGNVTNLSLAINTLGFSFLENSGLDFTQVTGLAEISDATVTVTYDYAVVPVPAAVWLFGTGLIGLAGIARRKRTREG